MRSSSKWIIMALVVSMLSPLTTHINVLLHNQEKCIVSLDVCNASGSFIAANDNATPSLHECCCKLVPFEFTELIEATNSVCSLFLFPFQIDRPPRA